MNSPLDDLPKNRLKWLFSPIVLCVIACRALLAKVYTHPLMSMANHYGGLRKTEKRDDREERERERERKRKRERK